MKTRVMLVLAMGLGWFLSSCAPGPGGVAVMPSDGVPWNQPQPSPGGQVPLAAEARKSERPAHERPGLATGWGDQKTSRVVYTSFQRSSLKPYGTDMMYYNDAEGVEAMAPRRREVDGMQRAAAGLVEWGIKGRFGHWATSRDPQGRLFVRGDKGKTYVIVVRNRCETPLEVVASVDGLDVIDGKPASYEKRGYVVQPGRTLEIDGFRVSEDQVSQFEFSSVASSYANLRHGDARNVGVIGLAVFTQKGRNPWGPVHGDVGVREDARPFATAP